MRYLLLILVASAAVTLAACGGDDNATSSPTRAQTATATATETASPSPGVEPTVVNVRLQDYSIVPNPTSGPAGDFQFDITNAGPSVHEFVLVKTDLQANALPTNSDGSVNEGDPALTPDRQDPKRPAGQRRQFRGDA